jgi:hypothetical protein
VEICSPPPKIVLCLFPVRPSVDVEKAEMLWVEFVNLILSYVSHLHFFQKIGKLEIALIYLLLNKG